MPNPFISNDRADDVYRYETKGYADKQSSRFSTLKRREPPKCTIPKLNYLRWEGYKRTLIDHPGDGGEVFDIDVLVDEPAVGSLGRGQAAFEPQGIPSPPRQSLGEPVEAHLQTILEASQLPERIQINSLPIIRGMEQAVKFPIGRGLPVVFVRPYKILDYFRNDIQSWYLNLKARVDNVETEQSKETIADTKRPMLARTDSSSSDDLESRETVEHMECLIKFMEETVQPYVQRLRSPGCQKVSFADLWHVFRPGDEVCHENGQQAYRVMHVGHAGHRPVVSRSGRSQHDQHPICIVCIYIDFDGRVLGPVQQYFWIERFDGLKFVKSLPLYPLRGEPRLRERLVARGVKFFQSTEISHLHYQGPTLDNRDEIDSQVVVDFEEAYSVLQKGAAGKASVDQGNERLIQPTIHNLVGYSFTQARVIPTCDHECCEHQDVYDDAEIDKTLSEDYIATFAPHSTSAMWSLLLHPRLRTEAQSEENPIMEWEYLIMTRRVWAYIMRSRKWSELDVTHLMSLEREGNSAGIAKDADTDTSNVRGHAFDQLVLPDGHKQMVKSLIAQHFKGKREHTEDDEYSDIIRGKGKGLVILLHGAPGVGKTTTAGDLGVWASDVERALEQNFSLANRWGCILLLDEADVFLAARTPTDMLRNGLVSVFLRILEYYSGVLFLTTNRVGDFDEAFASRIHMSLYYPPLDKDATLAIFELNIARIKKKLARSQRKINVKDTSIAVFASEYWHDYPKARWNGRQIRNACHTAAALAEFEAQGGNNETPEDSQATISLEVKHFEKVANAYLGFSEYLRDIYGVDADERAKENFLRAGQREPPAAAQPLLLRRNETPPSRPRQSYGGHDSGSSRREIPSTRPGYGVYDTYEHQRGPSMPQQFPSIARRGAAQDPTVPPPRPPPKPESLRKFSHDSDVIGGQQLGGDQGHLRPRGHSFAPVYEETDRGAMAPQPSNERSLYRSVPSVAPDEASDREPSLHWSRRPA
ncbi:hypothetical protein PG996_008174 [Apiospora saccharicola]|uniref:AAA+ ATPase domain-containing protein n=1 Tax=Apiospora saccharicola TaxID=335842 RepID=A0ABR1UX60_9PEZI